MDPTTGPGRALDSLPGRLEELAALLGREVAVEAVIGEKRVPLGDLARAAAGDDLLLLPRDVPVRLFAAAVLIGEGTAVEVAGRLALRIDRLRPLTEIAADVGRALRAGGDPFALQSRADPA
jgi:flagellar motor switch/type III secretory pathway protein FliN